MIGKNTHRGLASADEKTRQEVASKGGRAEHPRGRGLQNADPETRRRVASAGGRHSHDNDQRKAA